VPAAPDALGTLEGQVLGRYRVGPRLGTGHAGAVFHAQDVKTNQIVALKVLAPEFPANPAELQTFAQALKTATPLHHPNLINLLGAGKNGPYCWIAREYVEGDSVDVLVQRYKEENKLTWARAVRVAVHLAKALAFLHEHKVVHRNITPRNVLVVDADKMTKLTDLMLTTALAGSRLQKTIMEKKLLAELPYQAPEQVEPDAFVDHLADLYALGAVVYTLTTGEPPFGGTSPEDVIAKIRTTPVMRPTRFQRKLPFAFEGVVLKLLAKRQEDRYQTASELLADLEVLAQEHQIGV
jgi:serine/threonine-protein kinase